MRTSFLLTIGFFLASSSFASETDGVTTIESFNGVDKPISGLFGEPVPESYFSMNLLDAYSSGRYYRGSFSLITERRSSNRDLVSLFNPSNAHIDLTFSGVELATGKTKNFLVKIPANGWIQLDLTSLRSFDQVYLLSFRNFELYFDTPSYNRERQEMTTVEIEVPTALKQAQDPMSKAYDLDDNEFNIYVTLDQSGEFVEARAILVPYYPYNQSVRYQGLTVEYPFGYVYHKTYIPRSELSSADYIVTRSFYREVGWSGMNDLSLNIESSASARCRIGFTPEYTCQTPNRDAYTWTIVKSD